MALCNMLPLGSCPNLPLNAIVASMMTNTVPVPHEWYRWLASKGGSSVPKDVRSRATIMSAKAQWATRRAKYGKCGHAGSYERKAKAA